MTHAAKSALLYADVDKALKQHKNRDWGEAGKSLKETNRLAVKFGKHCIFSKYQDSNRTKFWVSTTKERDMTMLNA
jgi:hypothetical protein